MAVAMAASRSGVDVTIATRRPRRLLDGTPVVDLAEGATVAPAMDAVVVALPAPWTELAAADAARLPIIVDLSSPSAVPSTVREGLVVRFVGIDDLFETPASRVQDAEPDRSVPAAEPALPGQPELGARPEPSTSEPAHRYAERAEAEVARAELEFETWLAARPAATSAERLVERARRRSERRVERTLRRLPDLDERGRELVRQLADQLAADLLHEPLAHLRSDADGSARVAARDLFDL
jgi:glutamyl-tRNA reductase